MVREMSGEQKYDVLPCLIVRNINVRRGAPSANRGCHHKCGHLHVSLSFLFLAWFSSYAPSSENASYPSVLDAEHTPLLARVATRLRGRQGVYAVQV